MLSELNLINIVILIAVLLVSISVHEMMHAFTGFKLGDDTAAEEGRISLNPLKHIDPIMTVLLPIVTIVLFQAPILAAKPVPFNPERVKWDEFGAALIAFAGPASNLVLAFLSALALTVVDGGLAATVLTVAVFLNVSLFVFNLLPIPPLDGSRVVYAFAPDPIRRLFEAMEPYGLFIVIALVLFTGSAFGRFLGEVNQMVLNILP